MTTGKTSSDPTELQIALDNRSFEIQLFWQRSNYFMVLMTALGVGVFTIKEAKYALFVSIFATITSWFWYRTNLGSKFWHESWEVEVANLAKEQKIRSFERPTVDVIEQVKRSLEAASSSGDRSCLRKWLDKQILTKPSVSHYMILLSLCSSGLWALVSFSLACDHFSKHPIELAKYRVPPPSKAKPIKSEQAPPLPASNTAKDPKERASDKVKPQPVGIST